MSFLQEYVRSAKVPTIDGLVNNKLENVIAASLGQEDKSPDKLYAWWLKEFAKELKKQKKDAYILHSGYKAKKREEVKNGATVLVCPYSRMPSSVLMSAVDGLLGVSRIRYQAAGLDALGDVAQSSRNTLGSRSINPMGARWC